MQRTPSTELLHRAAESLWACTSFTESGLPFLSCKDFTHWGRLANCLTGLSLQGYHDDNELLTTLLGSLLSLDSPWKAKLAQLPPKGKTFELLIARLYLEELTTLLKALRPNDPTATDRVRVLWNQRVESPVTRSDRQVDVLIRWYRGSTSDIFTAVECKDTEVEVSDVEAFVTKIKTIGAHNGVMASSVGFQSGAVDTAKAFGVELRLVREEDLTTETVTEHRYRYRFQPASVHLEPPDDRASTQLPPDSQYRVVRGDVELGSVAKLVDDAVASALPLQGAWPPAVEVETSGAMLVFPDGRKEPLQKVYVTLALTQPLERLTIEKPRRPLAFSVHDVIAQAQRKVKAQDVPMLPPPSLERDRFYTNLFCQTYYCTSVTAETIGLVLLSDAQHGEVLDVEGTQLIQNAYHYYAIEDPVALEKLGVALERFKTLRGSPSIPGS